MTPRAIIKLANRRSERRADNNGFIGPSVYDASIFKGNLAISLF